MVFLKSELDKIKIIGCYVISQKMYVVVGSEMQLKIDNSTYPLPTA